MVDIKRKNFLLVQGRLLADGKQSHLTAEEWLYLYNQVRSDLVGVQTRIFATLALRIRARQEISVDTVAL